MLYEVITADPGLLLHVNPAGELRRCGTDRLRGDFVFIGNRNNFV